MSFMNKKKIIAIWCVITVFVVNLAGRLRNY
jgi:hypothetical protein